MILLDEIDAQEKAASGSEVLPDSELRFVGRTQSVRSHRETLPPYTPSAPDGLGRAGGGGYCGPTPTHSRDEVPGVAGRQHPPSIAIHQPSYLLTPPSPSSALRSSTSPTLSSGTSNYELSDQQRRAHARLHPRSASFSPSLTSTSTSTSPSGAARSVRSATSASSLRTLPVSPSSMSAPRYAGTGTGSGSLRGGESARSTSSRTTRTAPPAALRPANSVCVTRRRAPLLGTYVLDPALCVPARLLSAPSGSGAGTKSLSEGETTKENENERGLARPTLYLATEAGEICADVWVRAGCAAAVSARVQLRGEADAGEEGDAEEFDDRFRAYWDTGWDGGGEGEEVGCEVDEERRQRQQHAEMVVRSETGSVVVKLHAPRWQRFRLHASSTHGSVAVGLPRSFNGPIYTSTSTNFEESATHFPPRPPRRRRSTGDGSDYSSSKHVDAPSTSVTELPSPPTLRLSPELEDNVAELGDRKGARGVYFVGGDTRRWKKLGMDDWDGDELHIASRTGAVGVFFNTEPPMVLPKTNNRITKFLTKALLVSS